MNKKSLVYFLIVIVLLIAGYVFIRPKVTLQPSLKTFELVIQDKKLISGHSVIKLTEGDEVKVIITSDIDEEWHLHGYDRSLDLPKNKTVEISFVATLSGRFETELELSKTPIGVIEVSPK